MANYFCYFFLLPVCAVKADGCVDQINKARKAVGLKELQEIADKDKKLAGKAAEICPYLKVVSLTKFLLSY